MIGGVANEHCSEPLRARDGGHGHAVALCGRVDPRPAPDQLPDLPERGLPVRHRPGRHAAQGMPEPKNTGDG